jgi:hypothetical protein
MVRRTALLTVLLTLQALPALGETHRFAVIVGNNLGRDPTARLRYAEDDARKLHDVLVDLGDFAAKDVELLLDGDSELVKRALAKMEQRARRARRESGAKTLLVFYFSGHAEGGELELGSSSLAFDHLKRLLEGFDSDVRLAFLDSCESGALISTKGGKRGPGYEIQVQDEVASQGYAIITSSAHDEMSQESAEIRGAYFTHYLVSALRGAGDESGDGKVTVAEAYQYAYSRTLVSTSTTQAGSQHPMYHFRLEGRGEIVLTSTDRSGGRIAVQVSRGGRLVLVDGAGETMVAETDVAGGRTAVLAVRPGRYRAYLIGGGGEVRMARAEVRAGNRVVLGQGDFAEVELKKGVAKGGFFEDPSGSWTHRLGAGGLWRLFALEGATGSYGASAHYRALSPMGWEATVRLTWSTRQDVGLSTGYNDIGTQIGAAYVFEPPWLAVRVGVLVGHEYMFQEKTDERRDTSGLSYLGFVGLELPMNGVYAALDAGVGGRMFKIADLGLVHRLDFQTVLSLGWRWTQ